MKEKHSIQTALKVFSLDNLSTLPARFLSVGQRKRLNLARLSATYAPLWLLDEPTNSLDIDSVSILSRAISDHQKKGGMVAIATHEDLDQKNNILNLSMFTDLTAPPQGYNAW